MGRNVSKGATFRPPNGSDAGQRTGGGNLQNLSLYARISKLRGAGPPSPVEAPVPAPASPRPGPPPARASNYDEPADWLPYEDESRSVEGPRAWRVGSRGTGSAARSLDCKEKDGVREVGIALRHADLKELGASIGGRGGSHTSSAPG